MSKTDSINIVNIDETSVLEVGDSIRVTPSTMVIAVQREKAIYWENEFRYKDYPLFYGSIRHLSPEENLQMQRNNESGSIHVGSIDVLAIAAASVIHIGSSELIDADVRVKNIRHLLREPQE